MPFAMSEAYQALAVAKGDPARLVAIPNADHFQLTNPLFRAWPQVNEALDSCK